MAFEEGVNRWQQVWQQGSNKIIKYRLQNACTILHWYSTWSQKQTCAKWLPLWHAANALFLVAETFPFLDHTTMRINCDQTLEAKDCDHLGTLPLKSWNSRFTDHYQMTSWHFWFQESTSEHLPVELPMWVEEVHVHTLLLWDISYQTDSGFLHTPIFLPVSLVISFKILPAITPWFTPEPVPP